MKQKVICVIPARLQSTRFPQKILAPIDGKPMIQHVWEAATACPQFDSVHFAIDHEKTADVIEGFGGQYQMTSPGHATGTHRIAEFQEVSGIEGDIWVNWQGDQPFIQQQMIDDLLQGVDSDGASVWTLKKKADPEEINSPNAVKVVTDTIGRALYFSRSPIPHNRTQLGSVEVYKHIGLYAFTSSALKLFPTLERTPLSLAEDLEQLLFLEHQVPIQVYQTQYEALGVDMPQDLLKANHLASVLRVS